MKKKRQPQDKYHIITDIYREFLVAMLFLTAFISLLLLIRFSVTGSVRYAFLMWNLVLAWASSITTLWLSGRFQKITTWLTVLVLVGWLLFLPNAFYIVSDLIHLRSTGEVSVLYDAVLLFAFAGVGFCLGIASLAIVHVWLAIRTSARLGNIIMAVVILLCSFAIYLGRYLRWNSWDIVTNPLGLLIDVSNRVVYPLDNPRTLSTTFLFFTLIGTTYIATVWFAQYTYRRLRA